MHRLKNEEGYLLLSSVIGLLFCFMMLSFLIPLFNVANLTNDYNELSIQQFFKFFRDELIEAVDFEVSSTRVILHRSDQRRAIFEKRGRLVVRRIDGGYEVYLRDIQDIRFTALSYGMKVSITSMDGETYEKTLIYYPM